MNKKLTPIFKGNFLNKNDVLEQFDIQESDIGGEIIYAEYEQGSYDGSALVIIKAGKKLYEVNGSHCSCYGLEGQWSPEEFKIEHFASRKGIDVDLLKLLTTLTM